MPELQIKTRTPDSFSRLYTRATSGTLPRDPEPYAMPEADPQQTTPRFFVERSANHLGTGRDEARQS